MNKELDPMNPATELVVENPKKTSLYRDTYHYGASLAELAHADLTDHFSTIDHSPSASQLAAIRAILENLEAQANGTCPAAVHLSAANSKSAQNPM